jgi:hypothetical protein
MVPAEVIEIELPRGYRVRVYEREHFPRFHVGESLIPFCHGTIRRIGMLDKMKSSHFTKKFSNHNTRIHA